MAGVEQRGGQRQPQQPRQPEQTQPLQGRAAGRESLQGPTTVEGSAHGGHHSTIVQQPQPESVLSRAVERTRALYERNSWVFLPLGEAGKTSTGFPTLQGEQQPYGGGVNRPEVPSPKELPLPFEPSLLGYEQQTGNLDPEIEEAIRQYGMTFEDPQERAVEEERLRQGAREDRMLREWLLHPHTTPTLARESPDIIGILKKQEKKE